MAVVIYGHVALRVNSPWLFVLFIFPLVFIPLTRVYSCSRFFHQIAASFGTGCLGLFYSEKLYPRFRDWNTPYSVHVIGTFIIAGACVVAVALSVENNDSHFGGVSRSEYIRVVGGIMRGGGAGGEDAFPGRGVRFAGGAGGLSGDTLSGGRDPNQPTISKRKAARLARRRDSFFFLQRGMQTRSQDQQRVGMARAERFDEA